MREILRRGLGEQGLDAAPAERLEAFARMVLEQNRVMNLTAITDEGDFARLHLLDSTALLTLADFAGREVIDVGTGAGFPGVPLCIASGAARVTLLDSTGKRVDFLRRACAELGLTNADCVQARAEEYAGEHREAFDFAVSRAVAALNVLCELCLPLVKVGGRFIAMKSRESDEELSAAGKAVALLGGRVERVRDYPIPGCDVVHRAVIVEKTAPTPRKYPRAFGQIKKKPL